MVDGSEAALGFLLVVLADSDCAMERRDRRSDDRLVVCVNSILSQLSAAWACEPPERVNPSHGGDDIPPVGCSQGASYGEQCGVWIFWLSESLFGR